MSHDAAGEVSLRPTDGWHVLHAYYRFDRGVLAQLSLDQRAAGRQQFLKALDVAGPGAPARLQTSIVSGHKADFGLMIMDPDPLVVDRVGQRLAASALGPALVPTYSFVSMTEVSEYVPSVEQYGQRLVDEGEKAGSPGHEAKVNAYRGREEQMRRQRLYPELPPWPATCFYPMNKSRVVGANWFTLSFAERSKLMNEHARSGMKFAGKVSQLITVAVGLDDWEWGVTLWARNPQFLREIVYTMRFDQASAAYAEFGPFYTSYVCSPAELWQHCQIDAPEKA